MDASNKQETISEKFVRAWEKKNAKAARAGGVSLMALSLAACGSSSTTTTTTTTTTDTTTTTTPTAQTFTLTTKVDLESAFTGDGAADTFIADNTGTAEVTSTADTLNGGAGSDTLKIYSDGSVAAMPKLVSVENVVFYDEDVTFSLTGTAQESVTSISLIRGDGDIAVTAGKNVNTFSASEIGLNDAGAANGLTLNFEATVASGTVNLDNITIGTNTSDEDVTLGGAKLATVTVNTSGTASSFEDFNMANATSVTINAGVALTTTLLNTKADSTVTITGAGKVTLGAIDDDVDSLVATSNTGGIVATAANDNKDAVYTLSAAADTFTTDDDGFAAADKFAVDAGEGEDILVLAADADISTADEGGRYTNFDVLQRAINANYDTQYLSSTIDAASIGDGGLTNMTAAMAGAITVTADNAGSTFSLKTATGTADTIAFTSANATATASADLTTATVDGFESMSFAANSGDATLAATADRTSISFTSAADLKTITLTGSKSVNLDASSNAAKLTTINAADVVGGAVIATGANTGALTVTGSAVKDQITIGTVGTGGTTTVTSGAGDDLIIGTQANITAATSIAGGTGTDTLQISDAPTTTNALTVNDVTFKNVSGIDGVKFSGAIAGDLVWTLGGYADALATASSGNLAITAEALALGVVGDVVTINASGLSGTNATTMSIKNTHASATEASPITITGSDGADTITVEEAKAAADTVITVNGGKGADTLTVKTASDQDGAVVVTGGDGNDTISVKDATSDAAVTANLITAGAGDDTIVLDSEGAGTDVTLVLASTAALNGKDTITNFLQGTGEDVIKPDAFLNATAMNAVITANPGGATSVENDVNLLVDITGGQDITTAAGLAAALAVGGEYANVDMAASGKAVFVTASTNAAGEDQHVFFATSDTGGAISVVEVAVLSGTALDIDTWHSDNFAI